MITSLSLKAIDTHVQFPVQAGYRAMGVLARSFPRSLIGVAPPLTEQPLVALGKFWVKRVVSIPLVLAGSISIVGTLGLVCLVHSALNIHQAFTGSWKYAIWLPAKCCIELVGAIITISLVVFLTFGYLAKSFFVSQRFYDELLRDAIDKTNCRALVFKC